MSLSPIHYTSYAETRVLSELRNYNIHLLCLSNIKEIDNSFCLLKQNVKPD